MNRILQFLSSISLFIKRVTGFSHILFTAFFVLSILPLWGQGGNYPVQVIPQALPPASIYISNYADQSTVSSPLRVQIILNDFEIANREIRLKTYVVGSGLNFESNDLVVGASPLFLEGGVPLVLTNVDLAPYFQYENISGISPNVYGQPIPEGAYQFCFEVYDVLTGNRLSNRSCAVSVVFQNEPPFLVSPRNNTNVDEVNPQYIVFQWTPRSINVSNVEYELSLVEIWDNQVDPQQAFLSSPPIFQATTTSPTYVYGPSDPLLLSGKNYAWRVQAKARQGTEEIGLFKNEGYSEIFSFSYASACELPLGISHEIKGSTNANIFWDDFSTEIPEYTVRYRQKNVTDAEWFLGKTTTNDYTIWDLKAGTTYEYQLSKSCGITQSDWSITKEFTTALEFDEESVLDCGVSPDINLTNMEPLATIGVGAKFKAGDFPVEILEISGAAGRFTGKGYVKLPYLENIKVAVEFTNILINTDSEMAEGTVITVYDPTWKNILDVDVVIDVADDILDEFTGGDFTEYSVDFAIPGKENITIDQDNGVIVITGANGETTTKDYDEGDTYQITDSNNNTYNIDKEGNVTKGAEGAEGGEATAQNTDGISGGNGTASSPSVTNITATGISVSFEESSTTKYYLDKADGAYELANYPKALMPNGDSYFPVHKAVVESQTDNFIANISISDPTITINDLIVKTVSGQKIEAVPEGNTLKITVTGETSYKNQEAIITYKAEDDKYKIAASFFIHHIKQHDPINVVVVQVSNEGTNSTAINNLTTDLNTIYGKAGASFNVSTNTMALLNSDWDENDNDQLDYNGNGLLSNYPDELKNIQQAYKAQNSNWDRTAYHLFVLPSTMPITKPLAGFMPKTRQWGYIFNAQTSAEELIEDKESSNLTAAHELGHGAFRLDHPFSNDDNAAGSDTDWLMDYNTGDQLSYVDWARMSDEGLNLGVFQNQEDGEIANKVWFTPDWEPFTVDDTNTIYSKELANVPIGTIPGFNLNGKSYKATFEGSSFIGYYSGDDINDANKYNLNTYSGLNSDSEVYLYRYGGCGNSKYYKTKFYHVNATKLNLNFSNNSLIEYVGTIACSDSSNDIISEDPFNSLCDYVQVEGSYSQSDVDNAVKNLNVAYKKRQEASNITYRTKGDFYHLVNMVPDSFKDKADVIEDKLFLLKQKTNTNYYVVFESVSSKLSEEESNAFAAEVLTKSNIPPSEDTFLVIVPHITLTPLASGPTKCIQAGFVQSNPSVVTSQYGNFVQNSSLEGYILNSYKGIEKPLNIYYSYVLTNRNSSIITRKSNGLIRGFNFINTIAVLESKHYEAARNLETLIRNLKNADLDKTANETDSEHEQRVSEHHKTLVNLTNEHYALMQISEQEDSQKLSLADSENNDFTINNYFKIVPGKIDLREAYIDNNSFNNELLLAYTRLHHGLDRFGETVVTLAHYFGDESINKIENKHLYEGLDANSIIYEALDTASLVLSPVGLDIIPDVIGVVYASSQGDYDQAGLFSIGVITVGITAYAPHLIKYAAKYKIVAKLDNADNVTEYTVRNAQDAINHSIEKEIYKPPFANTIDEATEAAKKQLNIEMGVINLNIPVDALFVKFDDLRVLVNTSDEVFNTFKNTINGIENLSDAEKGALLQKLINLDDEGKAAANFISDFATKSNDLEKFARNTKLADSWTFLDGSPDIRKVVSNLENLDVVLDVKMFESAGISLEQLKTGINNSTSKKEMIERLKEASLVDSGTSVEDFLDAFSTAGKAIDHKMASPISGLPDTFPNINKSGTTSDLDIKWANRQAANTKQEKIVASELLAEARVDQIYESKGWQRLDIDGEPPGKQGKFDRIYAEFDADGDLINLHIVEAKGGGSTLGARTISDGTVAQQGTKQYQDNIIDILLGKDINDSLRNALENGLEEKLISYVLVNQKVDSKSNFVVKTFQ